MKLLGAILLAVMLVLTAQISLANSATWLSSPCGSALSTAQEMFS